MLLPELTALDDYRLRHNWSWVTLSGEMAKAGTPVSARTLHSICRRAHADATLRDHTLINIRKFLQRKRVRVNTDTDAASPRLAARVSLHQPL
jgi:hypothetical protein